MNTLGIGNSWPIVLDCRYINNFGSQEVAKLSDRGTTCLMSGLESENYKISNGLH